MTQPCRRNQRLIRSVGALLLFLSVNPRVAASVRDLEPGDRFQIETTVETVVTIDSVDSPARQTQLDRFTVAYRIDAKQNGRTRISARVLNAGSLVQLNETEERLDAPNISRILLQIEIDRNGDAQVVRGLDQMYAAAAGSNPADAGRLKAMVPADAVAGWLTAPFLLVPPDTPAASTATTADDESSNESDSGEAADEASPVWERIHETSLGPFGRIRSTITMQPTESTEAGTPVDLLFNARYVGAVPVGKKRRQPRLIVSAKDFTVDQVTGSGLIQNTATAESDADPNGSADRRRPWFESLEIQLQVSGTATYQVKGLNLDIPFRLKRSQKSRLLDYTTRRTSLQELELPPSVPPRR